MASSQKYRREGDVRASPATILYPIDGGEAPQDWEARRGALTKLRGETNGKQYFTS